MSNKLDKINFGITMLKLLLAFEVVLGHFCNWKEYNTTLLWPFRELVSLAVPCFMIISFYFMTNSLLYIDETKYRNRLKRLLIPQVGWAVIYFVVMLVLEYFFNSGIHVGFNNFLWQLFTGHDTILNPSMWYQLEVILITIIFYAVFRKFDHKKAYFIILALALFCYVLQYTGINYALFKDLRFELKYPLGRIAEMIPYAVIGLTLKYFNVYEKLKKYRYIIMPVCIAMFLLGFNIDWLFLKDFGFSGICKPYLAIWIVTFAYYTPLEYLPRYIKKLMLTISSYTLGIYCCHRLVYYLFGVFAPDLRILSFEKCILIYLFSYVMCYFINLIPNKNIKALVD